MASTLRRLIDAGWRVLFATTTDMVQKLQAARRNLGLPAMLASSISTTSSIDRSSADCIVSNTQIDDLANLIEAAIRHLDDDEPNPDTPTGWAVISRIHRRSDDATLARAIALCESAVGKQRRVGAAILGQLGHSSSSGSAFRSERFGALKQLVEGEARRGQDPEVLGDALVALGHLNDDRAIPVAVSLIGHSSAKVRRGLVMALSRHDDEAAIAGRIQLSCDSDEIFATGRHSVSAC
jgi:hypothetical protein